jgi:response regulator RpfG family c-di-GMP phosphodiesterase
MTKEKFLEPDSIEEELDYSGRPFDYRDMDTSTSMVCEDDPVVRQKIRENLKTLNFNIIEPTTSKEALKYTTFQTFNVIVVNENFNIEKDGVNKVLQYLEGLPMPVRRQIFIVLISSIFATMDYMNTLNKSVNLIINKDEISEIGMILKKEMEENEYFYHVFKDFQRKFGKV